MDAHTKLYAVFGHPVRHSKSPAIHNAAFRFYNINAAYLAFEIDNIKEGIDAVRTLNIQGASITVPFKQSIMKYLDRIDEKALAIGAVNTVVNKEGRLEGYNTDWAAAIKPLKNFDIQFGSQGKKICIIGAGGAAHAIAFGIARKIQNQKVQNQEIQKNKKNDQLVIINRSSPKGRTLAEKYNADFIPLNDTNSIQKIQPDILINTTPLGMQPDTEKIPFPAEYLKPHTIVMDIVYTPLKTRLLKEAETKGCTTIDGLSMFLHQGAEQFQLWTGILPDAQLLRDALLS